MPSDCIFFSVTLPTPGILPKGRVSKKAMTLCGGRTNCPFGLRQSDAIFAKNLFGAMPAEAVRPVSAKMAARISLATSLA